MVGEVNTASKINVSNAVARINQLDNGIICDMAAVSEMEVMEILAELSDCIDCKISQVSALGKD
jgi:hypothetical protein